LVLHLIVKFNHTADSIALIVVDIILCGIGFVCFNEFIQGIVSLEPYHQTYTYDTGNNLTNLSHQANSSAWQQTIAIHPNNNRGTETQQSATDHKY
jgi:hypothetical protein